MKVVFDLGDLENVAKATYGLMREDFDAGIPWNRSRIVTAAVQLVAFAPSAATC